MIKSILKDQIQLKYAYNNIDYNFYFIIKHDHAKKVIVADISLPHDKAKSTKSEYHELLVHKPSSNEGAAHIIEKKKKQK